MEECAFLISVGCGGAWKFAVFNAASNSSRDCRTAAAAATSNNSQRQWLLSYDTTIAVGVGQYEEISLAKSAKECVSHPM